MRLGGCFWTVAWPACFSKALLAKLWREVLFAPCMENADCPKAKQEANWLSVGFLTMSRKACASNMALV